MPISSLKKEPDLYLQLFHGRKRYSTDKFEELSDWGTDGPIFGPLCWVHQTYLNDIKLSYAKEESGDTSGELKIVEDLVYYDEVYYGDWSVFDGSKKLNAEMQARQQPFDESKAEPPILNNPFLCPNCGKENAKWNKVKELVICPDCSQEILLDDHALQEAIKEENVVYHLSYDKGKQVQEVLNRYTSSLQEEVTDGGCSEEENQQNYKDITYAKRLAELFD